MPLMHGNSVGEGNDDEEYLWWKSVFNDGYTPEQLTVVMQRM